MHALDWLRDRWVRSGIRDGDVVLLHSNTLRTLAALRREGHTPSVHSVLDSFLNALGNTGTLLVPLFNFGFNDGVPFDIRSTPSHMGALSEAARLRADAVRTGHPVYSFAAIGHHAGAFRGVDNHSGYGADSPFAILRRLNGKIAVLDIAERASMTFHHHVEEMNRVPYRYMKTFTGPYVDASGHRSQRSYAIYVRDLERGVVTTLDPLGERLWEHGVYGGDRPNSGTGLRVADANRVFAFVSELIAANQAPGHLYRLEDAHDR